MLTMGLSDEIRHCSKCIDLRLVDSNRLNTFQKPFVKFDVEKKWKPYEVKVLFIAESPPWNEKRRYFYNPNVVEKRTNLRKEVLKYLKLSSLEEFKKKGYFLVDTIKCRLKKRVPLRIARISRVCVNQFLHREIEELKPRTIFVLGNTAKKALQRFAEFEEMKEHKVSEGYDENLAGYRVILSVFPGGQTRKYRNEIERAFAKIRQH